MNTFEDRLRRTLRATEAELDSGTLARIGVARRRALAAPQPSWWRLHAPALGGAVLATAVAVAVLLPAQQENRLPDADAGGQMAEDPEFYEELDFYLWLAESGLGEHG
jgi:hypothetical protein